MNWRADEARKLEWGTSREELKKSILITDDCEEMDFILALNALERWQNGNGQTGDRFRALRYLADNVSPYVLRIVIELFRDDDEAEFQWQATLRRRHNPLVHNKINQQAKISEKMRITARNEQLAIRVIEAQTTGITLQQAISKVALGHDQSESNLIGIKPKVYGEETVRKAYQQTLRDGQKRSFLRKLKLSGEAFYETIPVPRITRGRPKKG